MAAGAVGLGMPTIVIMVSDLMFQPRIEAAAKALSFDVRVGEDAIGELGPGDALVVDLHERDGDPLAAIVAASGRRAGVLAFGRHTEPQTLRAARDAGADLAVPRSQLVEELPALLRQTLARTPAQP
jgi:DNA-binding NarL/FixJ family response regulator